MKILTQVCFLVQPNLAFTVLEFKFNTDSIFSLDKFTLGNIFLIKRYPVAFKCTHEESIRLKNENIMTYPNDQSILHLECKDERIRAEVKL